MARIWYLVVRVTVGNTSHATISTTNGQGGLVVIGRSSSSTALVAGSDPSATACTAVKVTLRTISNSTPGLNQASQSTYRSPEGWTRSRIPRTCAIPTGHQQWRMALAIPSSSICRTTLVQPRIPVHRILTPACHSNIISRIKEVSRLARSLALLRARGAVVTVDMELPLTR